MTRSNTIKFSVIAVTAAMMLFTAAPRAAEPDDVISRAAALPTAAALKMADSLSRAPAAPAPVKAQCLRFSGDHRFIREDYKKAAEFYRQAAALDSLSVYRHLRALALALDGRTDAAMEIWAAIAANASDPLSEEAALMTASVKPGSQTPPAAPPEKAPESPAKTNEKAEIITPVQQVASSNPQPATDNPQQSASAGQHLVPTDKQTTPPANQQQPASVNKQPVSTDKQPAPISQPPPASIDKPAEETLFTVQVGAFGSKDNANNLVKRLSETYKDITVSETHGGDQTLYRVRVGTFKSREEAAAFADKLTTSAGLSARVVER